MADKKVLDVEIGNGKYTVRLEHSGRLHVLRHGKEWRDLCGDNLVYALATEVSILREKIQAAEDCLVCMAIAPAIDVCENTLSILQAPTDV